MKPKKALRCAERVRAAVRGATTPEMKRLVLSQCASCGACADLAPPPEIASRDRLAEERRRAA